MAQSPGKFRFGRARHRLNLFSGSAGALPYRMLNVLLPLAIAFTANLWVPAAVGEKPRTGAETEKSFSPLKVPPGFKATLFACDPLIEYPSVIARGPRPGTLFVAVDCLTGLGTEIVRRDEIRLIEDTDGDGYADKATVYAKGFNSIQGMLYHNVAVFGMHAPLLIEMQVSDDTRKL